MKVSKVIKYTLSLAFAALLLYVSFRSVDWKEFYAGLRSCRWPFIAVTMAASVAAFFFRSQRWRCLLQPFDSRIDSLTAFNCVNIGYLANFAFPRIGEVVRCGVLSRRSVSRHPDSPEEAVSFDRAVGTVLLSRTWDVIVVFVLLAVLLAARWRIFGDFFINHMLRPAEDRIGRMSLLVAAICIFSLAAVLLYLRFRRPEGQGRVRSFLHGMADGFRGCLRMEHKVAFFVYTVLMWAMYWLMSMSVIWAMPQIEGLGAVDAWFVCLAGSVAWMIPVPGGFGAYHGMVALALSSIYGIAWDTGLLCATLNHEAQAVTMIICGIISYLIELYRK